ncbi:MAG: Exportin-5 [Marteilia pararefringens]
MASELKELIRIVYDPRSRNEEKNEALRILDTFKKESKDVLHVGAELIDRNNHDNVRFFALQLIEHYIKFSWNSINEEEQLSIRSTLLEIIENDILRTENEAPIIKKKIASLIVELVKRQWPQLWTGFIGKLLLISKIDIFRMELSILILNDIFTQINNNTIYPIARRQGIVAGILSEISQILEIMMHCLQHEATKDSNNYLHLGVSSLRCFDQLFLWISVKKIGPDEKLREIFTNLLKFLNDPKYSFESLNCLCSLTDMIANKMKKSIQQYSAILLQESAVRIISDFSYNFTDENIVNQGPLLSRYTSLISNYNLMILYINQECIVVKFCEYHKILLLALLRSSTLSLGRHTKTLHSIISSFLSSSPHVLQSEFAFTVLQKFMENSQPYLLDQPFQFKIDSSLVHEKKHLESTYREARNNIMRLLETIDEKKLEVSLEYFTTMLSFIHEKIISNGIDNFDPTVVCACLTCEIIFKKLISIRKDVYMELVNDERLKQILVCMLSYKGSVIKIIEICAIFASTFIFITFKDVQFLETILQYFLNIIFVADFEKLSEKSFFEFNDKIIKRFHSIFKLYSKEIYNIDNLIVQNLITSVYEFIWKLGKNRGNLVYVVESIVLLVNESPDIMFQRQLLSKLLEPVYLFFRLDANIALLENEENFINGLSLTQSSDASATASKDIRNKLSLSLEIISSINRKSRCLQKSSMTDFGPSVIIEYLPYLLKFSLILQKSIIKITNTPNSPNNPTTGSAMSYFESIYPLILNIFGDLINISPKTLIDIESGVESLKISLIDNFDQLPLELMNNICKILFLPISTKSNSNDASLKATFAPIIVPLLPKICQALQSSLIMFSDLYLQENLPSSDALLSESIVYNKITTLCTNFVNISQNILYDSSKKKNSDQKIQITNANCVPIFIQKNLPHPSNIFLQILTNMGEDLQAKNWLKEQINFYFYMLCTDFFEISHRMINLINYSLYYLFSYKKNGLFNENEWIDLFGCLIKSLEKHGKNENMLDNYILMICFVYANISEGYNVYDKLKQVDTIISEYFEKFNSTVKSNSLLNKASEKTMKNNFKLAFDNHISKSIMKDTQFENLIKNIPNNNNVNTGPLNGAITKSESQNITNFSQMSNHFGVQ